MLFSENSDHCTWDLLPNFTFKPKNKGNDKVQNKECTPKQIHMATKI